MGGLRIVLGIVWGIDACFKWQPGLVDNIHSYLTGAPDGQPWAVHQWIGFSINVVHVDPTVFAHLLAAGRPPLPSPLCWASSAT